jgi:hypothetical protein
VELPGVDVYIPEKKRLFRMLAKNTEEVFPMLFALPLKPP